MIVKGAFEKAKNYIDSHVVETNKHNEVTVSGPCITISRETGAGAEAVSQLVSDNFAKSEKYNRHPWTIFDQNLIEKVLQDHHLPQRLSKIMEERKYSAVSSIMNELIVGQPGTWTLFHKTTETILQLAHIGYSIIVERGGNIITSQMDNCLHIRLVANIEDKIDHIMKIFNLTRKEALDYINNEDENRREFIKTYFHKNIDDPTLYHMILNTSNLSYQQSADIISSLVRKKCPEFFQYSDQF